jgi:hypothetical protein
LAGIVILLGIFSRLFYWQTYPLKWKLHAVFNPIEFSTVGYISDFIGYAPTRLPFFDVFSAIFYVVFSPLFGTRALSVFNLTISIVSLVFFYLAVSKLFSREVGLFSTIIYSLYPKSSQLAAVGFPEASSIGFIAISLYILSIILKEENNSILLYGTLGILVLLSWLMYIPAVVFGVIVSIYLFSTLGFEDGFPSTLVDLRYWLAVSPSGLVGILYLIFGPIQRVTNRTSSTYLSEPTLFINAEEYTLIGKSIRYIAYTYFDFWWHRSGFDHESSILPLYKGLNEFLGPFFEIYFIGYIIITLIISIFIIHGIYFSSKNIDEFKLFLLSVIIVFATIWNLKNMGWRGTFQTRHVFPIFPALCIMFGIGVSQSSEYVITKINKKNWELPADIRVFMSILLIILFAILLVNGGMHGVIRGEKYEVGREDPANQLNDIISQNESVGVVQGRLYRSTILYTEGSVRPIMFVETNQKKEDFKKFSPHADVRIINFSNPELDDIDYVYIKSECNDMSGKNKQILDYALQNGGEIVYQTHKERGGFRCSNIDVYVVRLA